jgi:hypothetical protein
MKKLSQTDQLKAEIRSLNNQLEFLKKDKATLKATLLALIDIMGGFINGAAVKNDAESYKRTVDFVNSIKNVAAKL